MIILKTKEEIKRIKDACWIVADVLNELKHSIDVGVTTLSLNHFANELTRLHKAKPAFLGYNGYPFTICASVNDQIVHGFPSERRLEEGDIITIDYGAIYNGWCGDAAFTAGVGKISLKKANLMRITERCLNKAIEKAIPGNRIGDISNTIQITAEAASFNPVRAYTGHGIGRDLHEEPSVFNYGKANEGIMLKEGMVIAIEPIISAGSYEVIHPNGCWDARTKDGSCVAQFEHTVAVTEKNPIILTTKES